MNRVMPSEASNARKPPGKRQSIGLDGNLRPDAIPMVGKRYGSLVVVREMPRRDAGLNTYGHRVRQRAVLCRCDCGAEWEALAYHVRRQVRSCLSCARKRNVVVGRTKMSVRLSNGWTLSQVALVGGLQIGTVYRRWLRGWPDERLGEPLHRGDPGDGRSLGGSRDLPERRRTMLPGVARGAS